MAVLPPTQRAVLASLILLGADGWPVSIREIQRLSGIGAVSTIYRALQDLTAAGFVARNPRSSNGGIWKPLVDSVPPA